MKHTPGPWEAKEYGIGKDMIGGGPLIMGIDIKAEGSRLVVARIPAALGEASTDTDKANARLIALAPKMIELAKEVAAEGCCLTPRCSILLLPYP